MMQNNLLGEIIDSKWLVNNHLMLMQFKIQQLSTEIKKVWMRKNMRIQQMMKMMASSAKVALNLKNDRVISRKPRIRECFMPIKRMKHQVDLQVGIQSIGNYNLTIKELAGIQIIIIQIPIVKHNLYIRKQETFLQIFILNLILKIKLQ